MAPPSSSSALALTPSPSAQPPASLRGQRLLSEADYISSLSSLIQRDFFPNLPRLTAENEYLSALEDLDSGVDGAELRVKEAERDLDRMDREEVDGKQRRRQARKGAGSNARRPPSRFVTPSDTPVRPLHGRWDPTPLSSGAETPGSEAGWATPSNSEGYGKAHATRIGSALAQDPRPTYASDEEDLAPPPELSGHSISSFQHSFTSEDNASFLALVQSTNDRRKEKYAWAFRQERNHNARRKLIMDEATKRADEGYARSVLALPETKRRKLIEGGSLGIELSKRVADLERTEMVLGEGSNGKSKAEQQFLTYDPAKAHRALRASSEEGTSASTSSQLVLLPSRHRSTSPPTLSPLKHSLDPRSEIALVSTSSANKVSDDSEMEDPSFDPNAILRRAKVVPTTATTYAGTKYAARNALFFGPDAEIGTTDRVTSSLPEHVKEGATSAERLFHAREKLKSKTVFHNTALPSQGVFPEARYPDLLAGKDSSSVITSASPRSSRIESAMAGGSRYGDNFDDESGEDLRYAGPTVNGFGFVSPAGDLTPNRAAMEEELAESLEQKRRQRLLAIQGGGGGGGRAEDGPRSFFVPPTPKRDELASSLANKSASSRNRTTAKGSTSGSLRTGLGRSLGARLGRSSGAATPSRRSEALSPAARTLLDRSTRGGLGSGLGGFLTPSRATTRTPNLQRSGGSKDKEKERQRKPVETLGGMLGKRGWEDDTPKAGTNGRKR